MRKRFHAAVLVVFSFSFPLNAGVLVVDKTGGAGSSFNEIGPAVAAAVDGDTLLIRPGSYDPATIDGKGLTLAGDAPLGLVELGPMTVRNLSAGQTVSFVSLSISAINAFTMPASAVNAQNCAGSIVFDRCDLRDGNDTVVLKNCAAVVFSDSEISGGDEFLAFFFQIKTGAAVRAEQSTVAFFDCSLAGGDGQEGAEGFAFDELVVSGAGAPALRVGAGSTVSVAASDLAGGRGGDGFFAPMFGQCFNPGAGGAGLLVEDAASSVASLGSVFTAGIEGTAEVGCPQPGVITAPIVAPTGAVSISSYLDRDFALTSPVRAGQSAALTLTAVAGDVALLLLSSQAGFTDAAPVLGVIQPGLPAQVFTLGTVPASGQISVGAPLPLLPPSLDAVVLFTQVALKAPTGKPTMSEPRVLLVVNQVF